MKIIKKIKKWVIKNKFLVIAGIIFIFELILRFYNVEKLNPFGYDQVDNAWTAKNFIVEGQIPLVGMVAKGNTGIFIGPFYYYMITFFYWIYNLNPIASGIFAGVTSIFTFWSLFYVTKKIFSWQVALIAVFINTFALSGIIFDRIQWPVNFIPGISILIFYFLYKVITGNPKYIIALALAIGFSFQIHFTSIFFPLIVTLSLPFFPRTKETLKYIFISIPLFLVWLIPSFISLTSGGTSGSSLTNYLNTSYHGFHLRRVMQLIGDGVIQFQPFFYFKVLTPLKYFLIPLFFLIYLHKNLIREKVMLSVLISFWFLIPLLVFSTYSGELSDYYFAINRFVALMIISYLIFKVFSINLVFKSAVLIFLAIYCFLNVRDYVASNDTTLYEREQEVIEKIEKSEQIQYTQGDPNSYLFYYYMREKGVGVYE